MERFGLAWPGLAVGAVAWAVVGEAVRRKTKTKGRWQLMSRPFFFSGLPCLPCLPIPTFEFATLPSWRNWRASRGWSRTWRGKATARQRRERDGGEKRLLLALVGVSAQKGVTGWRRSARDERHEVDLGEKGKKKGSQRKRKRPSQKRKF